MRISKKADYAVLTGDIVGSRSLGARARKSLPADIRKAGRLVRRGYRDACPLGIGTFRGDGWQLLVSRPERALEIAVFFRAALRWITDDRRIDSRVAVGVGKVDFVPGDRVSEGDGEAFRRSGKALDAMESRARLALGRAGPEGVLTLATLALLVGVVASWTPARCQAVVGAMSGQTQDAIADAWSPEPITQQAVAQHLDGARWHAVERALSALAALLAGTLEQA